MLLTAKKETEAGMDDINNILRDLSIGKIIKGIGKLHMRYSFYWRMRIDYVQ